MEKKVKGRINLIKGKGVVSVSVDNCIESYYAEMIRTRRKLKYASYVTN